MTTEGTGTLIRQIATFFFVLSIAFPAIAQVSCDHCVGCDSCAEPTPVDWTCHAIPSTQWVEVSVWDVECEPVCLAGCAGIHGSCCDGCDSAGCASADCDSAGDCHGKKRFGLCDFVSRITRRNRVRTRKKLVRRTQRVMVPAIEYVFEPIYPTDGCCDYAGYTDVEGVSQLAASLRATPHEAPQAVTMWAAQPLPPIVPRDQADTPVKITAKEPVIRHLSSEAPVRATLDVNDVPTSIQTDRPPSPSTARRTSKIYLVQ